MNVQIIQAQAQEVQIQEVQPQPIKLRDYQIAAKKELYSAIRAGAKRIMVNAPCAWGKCYFAGSIAHDAAIIKNKKVLFVVPFRTLVRQAIESFENLGMKLGQELGVLAGGYPENPNAVVTIATIQTLGIRKATLEYDILILDECHILAFSTWFKNEFPLLLNGLEVRSWENLQTELYQLFAQFLQPLSHDWDIIKCLWKKLNKAEITPELRTSYKVLNKYKAVLNKQAPTYNKDAIIIGLTGSPWRLLKTEWMSDSFTHQIKAQTPKQMVEMMMLTPCVYYAMKGVNTDGLAIRDGDFKQEDLEVVCTTNDAIGSIVENYIKLAKGKTFICFPVSIKHANILHTAFNMLDINTHVITGEMPDKEREVLFEKLLNKEIDGLISVGCLSVGFDVPNIECVIMARPTLSKSLYVQQVGRGMRLAENKEYCVVLDQAGNVKRFGMIESISYPDLEKEQIESQVAPVKECQHCGHIDYAFALICSECGESYPETTKKEKKEAKGKMELLLSPEEKEMFKLYQTMLKKAFDTFKMPEWAKMQLIDKGFKKVPSEWSRNAIWESTEDVTIRNSRYNLYGEYLIGVVVKKLQFVLRSYPPSHPITKSTLKKVDQIWFKKWLYNEFGKDIPNPIIEALINKLNNTTYGMLYEAKKVWNE